MKRLLRRPSPATVLALVALFVALGGTAFAAATIRGRDVVDRTLSYHDVDFESLASREIHNLRGRDLEKDSLGGYHIDEAALQKVPSAKSADQAATALKAGTADRVGDQEVRRFVTKIATNGAEQPVVALAGLTLFASCPGGTPAIRATTAVNDAEINGSVISAADAPIGARSADFDAGESFDVDQARANATGMLAYAQPAGAAATVSLGFGAAPSFGGTNAGCAVHGTAIGG